MDGKVRRKLETAKRVRDFNRAHPLTDPSHAVVATRFEERLAKAESLAIQEQAGRLESGSATRRRKEARKKVEVELMRYVSRVAQVAQREYPELNGRFVMPSSNATNATLLARAWDMLNLAKAHQEALGKHGLAGTQIDQLASELNRFEEVTEVANAGRRAHVGARAELLSTTAELMELIGLLDLLNRSRFRLDPRLLAAWSSAKNVTGPFRTVPPTDGGVDKAA